MNKHIKTIRLALAMPLLAVVLPLAVLIELITGMDDLYDI